MPSQHLLPVALPRGRTGNTGLITIFFSPRLKDMGPPQLQLQDYPEWLRWPDMLNRMSVRLRLTDTNGSALVTPTRVSIAPDPLKWENTFARQLPVDPHRFVDWSVAPLRTVATSDFNEAVLDLYTRIAVEHAGAPPSQSDVFALPQAQQLSQAVGQAINYLAPMEGDGLEAPADPEWDFHQYLSLLSAHPALLRHLGIAVDYEFAFPASVPVPSAVSVRTTYESEVQNGPGREVELITQTTDGFFAAPNPDPAFHEQSEGFLELAKQGAYLSILDAFSTATRMQSLSSQRGQIDDAVPALITRALTLVRPDLITAFQNRTERQREIESQIRDQLDPAKPPTPVDLWAEDVTAGYRLDVRRDSVDKPAWLSLFDRQTDASGYQFIRDPSLNVTPAPDEGWAQTLLLTELEEDLSSQITENDVPLEPYALRRLDDQLYRWDGWSGAVERPGKVADGTDGKAIDVDPQLPPSDAWVQFAASYQEVPGTLPQLRFGETYQMRARCVDLAGNSVGLDAVGPAGTETDKETFGRLEPIGSPYMVRRLERPYPGVGDDAVTLVLLGDYDTDDKTLEAQERLLFPPRVGQDLCELHGEPAGGADQASYALLASLDAREPEDQWTIDPLMGEPIAEGKLQQPVEYLSDPAAGDLRAFRWGPNGGEYIAKQSGTWPEATSARIELMAGEAATLVSPDDTTEFRFVIPKADIVSLDFSYAPRGGKVEQFGLWHRASAEEQDSLRPTVESGAHWMFSARRSARLVYAVRRPLLAPYFCDFENPIRQENDTGVTLNVTLKIDRRSTGSATMRATWTDSIDDISLDAPVAVDGGAWLGRFETPRKADPSCVRYSVKQHRAELGDTRRHLAQIHLEAFSYFSSYFTEERVVTMSKKTVMVDERGLAESSISVRHGPDSLEAQPGVDYEILSEAGKIRRTRGSAIKRGSDVTVRYIPLPVSRGSGEHPAYHVLFPNTATPPRPKVDMFIPAAARTIKDASATHDGRVIRVYLKRPWNVSGDGEQLAVMIEHTPDGVGNATRLGRDPAVNNATELLQLRPSAFSRANTVVNNYDGIHDLALHDVEYDADSQRWFADIAVTTDAYRPFLQLVLARYQRDSIPGKHLSPPVTLEPVRLGVSREVELAPRNAGFDIVVSGREHAGIPALAKSLAPNEVTVSLQEADERIADPDLRWLTTVKTVALERVAGPDGTTWSGYLETGTAMVPRRLLIEESEPALFGGEPGELVGHVIYSEALELSAP